jgi:CDP-glucose 4,6-dehydratase
VVVTTDVTTAPDSTGSIESTDTWAGRSVFVTGATGLLGSAMCRRLVDEGAQVTALVLDVDPQTELYRSGTVERLSVVNGDLRDLATLDRAIVGSEAEVVLHLGAQTIVGAAHRSPLPTLEANVAGTWNVLEACRLHPDLVKAVVVASSDKAYGENEDLPYVEDMALNGVAPYEVSKSCTDLVTRSYALTFGVPAGVARCGNTFGGGDLNWSRIVPGTIRSLVHDQRPVLRSDGTHVRDYVFVDDIVDGYLRQAHRLAAGELTGEAFNFGYEQPRTVMEIYRAVCEAFGAGDVEPEILDRTPGEIQDQYLSCEKAAQVLGWKASIGLEEGLARTVAWYRRYFAAAGGGPT